MTSRLNWDPWGFVSFIFFISFISHKQEYEHSSKLAVGTNFAVCCAIESEILLSHNSSINKKLIKVSDILDTICPNVLFIFALPGETDPEEATLTICASWPTK